MKNAKIFLIPFLTIFLLSLVSAGSVAISLSYDETVSNSLSITNGNSFGVIANADSILEDSMTIKLDLLNSNGNFIANLLDVYTTDDSYFNHLIVGQSVYIGSGNYTLKGTATAVSGQSDVYTLSLEVKAPAPANHVPVITSTPITEVNENQDYIYQVTADDEDHDALTYSLTQNPDWLSIDAAGLISGTAPEVDSDYEYAVTVNVSDGKDFILQTYALKVKDVPVIPTNHVPIITSTPVAEIDEGLTYSYHAVATDADGNALIYSLTQNPAWLSIDGAGLISGLAPHVNSNTDYPITIKVSDGKGGIATQSYTLTVKNVAAPIITVVSPINGQTCTSSSVSFEMITNKDVVSAWYVLDNSGASQIDRVAHSYNHFLNTVSLNDGTHHVIFYATDSSGNQAQSSEITFYVDTSVPPTNHIPVITSSPLLQINEGQFYAYQVTATDADGDALAYSLTQNPAWLSINANTGLISGTSPLLINLDAIYPITVRVSDGKGGIVTQTYILTVRDVPSPPITPGRKTGNNAVTKTISNKYETEQYLSQFGPKTITEEEQILVSEKQPTLLSKTLWIWLLGVGILIFIVAIIILWRRE